MAQHEIAWTLRAVADVAEATRFIGADDPEAAERWEAGLTNRVERAAELPLSGRVVPEIRRKDLREIIYGRYRLVYQVTASHVIVVRVLEGHRQLPDDLASA